MTPTSMQGWIELLAGTDISLPSCAYTFVEDPNLRGWSIVSCVDYADEREHAEWIDIGGEG